MTGTLTSGKPYSGTPRYMNNPPGSTGAQSSDIIYITPSSPDAYKTPNTSTPSGPVYTPPPQTPQPNTSTPSGPVYNPAPAPPNAPTTTPSQPDPNYPVYTKEPTTPMPVGPVAPPGAPARQPVTLPQFLESGFTVQNPLFVDTLYEATVGGLATIGGLMVQGNSPQVRSYAESQQKKVEETVTGSLKSLEGKSIEQILLESGFVTGLGALASSGLPAVSQGTRLALGTLQAKETVENPSIKNIAFLGALALPELTAIKGQASLPAERGTLSPVERVGTVPKPTTMTKVGKASTTPPTTVSEFEVPMGTRTAYTSPEAVVRPVQVDEIAGVKFYEPVKSTPTITPTIYLSPEELATTTNLKNYKDFNVRVLEPKAPVNNYEPIDFSKMPKDAITPTSEFRAADESLARQERKAYLENLKLAQYSPDEKMMIKFQNIPKEPSAPPIDFSLMPRIEASKIEPAKPASQKPVTLKDITKEQKPAGTEVMSGEQKLILRTKEVTTPTEPKVPEGLTKTPEITRTARFPSIMVPLFLQKTNYRMPSIFKERPDQSTITGQSTGQITQQDITQVIRPATSVATAFMLSRALNQGQAQSQMLRQYQTTEQRQEMTRPVPPTTTQLAGSGTDRTSMLFKSSMIRKSKTNTPNKVYNPDIISAGLTKFYTGKAPRTPKITSDIEKRSYVGVPTTYSLRRPTLYQGRSFLK